MTLQTLTVPAISLNVATTALGMDDAALNSWLVITSGTQLSCSLASLIQMLVLAECFILEEINHDRTTQSPDQ